MQRTIYQVDAFTEQVFKGNPAGVMILKEKLAPELMQNIAKEMNLSETAFVDISEEPFQIRFFTPTVEIPLCGHATLASAHILYENKIAASNKVITFKALGGNLKITSTNQGVKMVFPVYEIKQKEILDQYATIIGFAPIEMYSSEGNWVIAVAENEVDVKKAQPKFSQMESCGLGQLIITSHSEQKNIDFVVRCFAPAAGINEDPVTGSAQCALVPIWNLKTGETTFKVEQVSERTGKLDVKLLKDKVEIVGKAVTVFKAEMSI